MSRRVVLSCCLVFSAACYTSQTTTSSGFDGSTLLLAPPNVVGTDTGKVTIALADKTGKPQSGFVVQLLCADCDVTQPTGPTNSLGLATATIVGTSAAGQHALTATVTDAGQQITLTATSSLKSLAPATADTNQLQAGATLNAQAIILNDDGTVNTSFTGEVHFASSDTQATLPPAYTFVAADHGVKVFKDSVVLRTPGTQTVTAVVSATNKTVETDTYVVVPGALGKLVFTTAPSNATAGEAISMTVSAQSATNNVIGTYTGTLAFASSDSNAILPAAYTFVPEDQGQHTFSVTLKASGVQTVQVSDGTVASSPYDVLVGPAAQTGFSLYVPTTLSAGVATTFTLAATDQYGNVTPSYSGTVHFTSNDNQAQLPPDYAFQHVDAGKRNFDAVSLRTAGQGRTVTVVDTSSSSLTATATGITVNSVAATQWSVTASGTSFQAGAQGNVTVSALDPYHNVAVGYTGQMSFAAPSDARATVPQPYTFTASDAGTKVFPVTLTVAGSARTFTATDVTTNVVAQASIAVTPGASSTFAVSGIHQPATANFPYSLAVTATDDWGNTTPSYTGTVSFTSTDPNADIPSAVTISNAGTASAGSFTFANNGNQTITITDGTHTATSSPYVVNKLVAPVGHEGFSMCAVINDGQAKCWGHNADGELGQGDTVGRGLLQASMGANLPPISLGTGRHIKSMVGGIYHYCAILDNNSTKCWGLNATGQLGVGDANHRGQFPSDMGDNLQAVDLGTDRYAVKLSAGERHTCAILNTSELKCWGYNGDGELGLGDTNNRGDFPNALGDNLPPIDLGTGRTAIDISCYSYGSCAILDDHTARCWGYGNNGENGQENQIYHGSDANQMGDNLPAVSLGTGRTAVALAGGAYHNCAVLDDGSVKCWGYGGDGQLGTGDTALRGASIGTMGDALPTVPLGIGRTAIQISAGWRHVCAVLDNQTLRCWGTNNDGELGLGDNTARGDSPENPQAIPTVNFGTSRTIVSVSTGTYMTCAQLTDGTLRCFGFNQDGELGTANGLTTHIGVQPSDMGDALLPAVLW